MSTKSHIIYLSVIIFLVVALCFSFSRPTKVVEKEIHTTDTTIVHKIDTMVMEVPKYVEKVVERVDTLYLKDEGIVPLEFAKTRYQEENVYDLWIEGYNAKLSSIMVFPKTEYRYITNTITKEVLIQKWNFYTGLDLGYFRGAFVPSMGIYATSPKKWLFGAKFGYYTDTARGFKDNFYVGATIAYKLNK